MVDYPDILNYTREELIEEFCKLFDRHQELRESSEADAQRIHELKRTLDTAVAAQSYLSQELEQYTNADNTQNENELQKTISELTELKKKYMKLEELYGALQQDYNTLLEENATLSQSLEEATKRTNSAPIIIESQTSEEDLQRLQMLEHENMELLEKIEEFQEHTIRYTLTIGEYEKNIEILQDQINCLEENFQSKKSDLEEKMQMLESTQEQLTEANAQIAMLSSTPEAADRKGNSLFAEVDDQRQVMRKLLAAQKQNYLQMKKIYNESEHEIRRLKRENIAMHKEMETCSSIFCNADKVYQDKLNERIRHLSNQNEELERKLNWTQERLQELASEKGVLWLDSMLSLCKKETDDLKKQLHSVRIQKASLEEQLRNSQQDMIRWRFESLKSRCILLDREHLLTENAIQFKPVQALEFHITEKQQNEARPRIVSERRSSILENIQRRSLTPLKVSKNENENENENCSKEQKVQCGQEEQNLNSVEKTDKLELINDTCENLKQLTFDDQDTNKNEPKKTLETFEIYTDSPDEGKGNSTPSKDIVKSKFSKMEVNPPSPMRLSQRSLKTKETFPIYTEPQESDKENSTPSNNNTTTISLLTPQQDKSPTSAVRSILIKQRNDFSPEKYKNVKFSSTEDLVYHLTPIKSPSPIKDESKNSTPLMTCNNKIKTPPKSSTSLSPSCKKNKNNKAVAKGSRNTSNVVVRRIVVGSKHN